MAILYGKTKWDFHTEGPSLTEQEHKKSCDINVMMQNLARGQAVRGNNNKAIYGFEDMNMDLVQHRIQKEKVENALLSGEKEFPKSIFDTIPENIRKKFGFRIKKEAPNTEPPKNDLNDPTGSPNPGPTSTPPAKPNPPPAQS